MDNNVFNNISASKSSLKRTSCNFTFNVLSYILYGQYPKEMLEDPDLSKRLKEFSPNQSEKLIFFLDFVGLNYHGAFFSTHSPMSIHRRLAIFPTCV